MTGSKLSEAIKSAEIEMLQAKRQARPMKDSRFSSVEDREAEMSGLAATQIANYNHLVRLWELERELHNG